MHACMHRVCMPHVLYSMCSESVLSVAFLPCLCRAYMHVFWMARVLCVNYMHVMRGMHFVSDLCGLYMPDVDRSCLLYGVHAVHVHVGVCVMHSMCSVCMLGCRLCV